MVDSDEDCKGSPVEGASDGASEGSPVEGAFDGDSESLTSMETETG